MAVGAKGAGAATERLQKELDKLKCVAAPGAQGSGAPAPVFRSKDSRAVPFAVSTVQTPHQQTW